MSKSLKLSLAIIVAAAVTLVIVLVATNDGDPDTEPTTGNADQTSELLVRDDSPRLTSGTEAVFVEFLDFECEGCLAVYPLIEDLRDRYEDRVTFVVRHMPLHTNSVAAALVAEAAAEQGEFEAMYQRLFETAEQCNTLLLPADTLAAHTTEGAPQQILVKADQGTDPDELASDLREWAADHDGLAITDRDVLLAEFDDAKTTANFAIYIMVLMIAGYAAITVINTLASSVAARRRELGLQRLAGSTRAQVMQMVTLEGAIVALSGLALGELRQPSRSWRR
mgnify:CR=1 FL=1